MEYVLQKTDIFDEEIGDKFEKVFADSFIKGNDYKLTVSFHVNLLNDVRFENFHIPVPSKTNKGTREDKISDVMSTQLKELKQVLSEKGIEVSSATIQGDYLDAEDMIKIEVSEDDFKPTYTGKGKKKAKVKVTSIIPSRPFIQEKASKMASERNQPQVVLSFYPSEYNNLLLKSCADFKVHIFNRFCEIYK